MKRATLATSKAVGDDVSNIPYLLMRLETFFFAGDHFSIQMAQKIGIRLTAEPFSINQGPGPVKRGIEG